jgi:hypothetical protein
MRLVLLALIHASFGSTLAFAGARQEAKVLMASDPASLKFQQDWGFSDAVVTGDTIFLSGGKIDAIGADLPVPAGAHVIDGHGTV